jgi:hypothetical protein
MINYKKVITLTNFYDVVKAMPNVNDYPQVIQLGKLAKKMQPVLEQMNDEVDDIRIDHCNKEKNKITRDAQGNYEFTADGERAFKKAYRELLIKPIEVQFTPLNYADLCQVLPEEFARQNSWEAVSEFLEPFYFV